MMLSGKDLEDFIKEVEELLDYVHHTFQLTFPGKTNTSVDVHKGRATMCIKKTDNLKNKIKKLRDNESNLRV